MGNLHGKTRSPTSERARISVLFCINLFCFFTIYMSDLVESFLSSDLSDLTNPIEIHFIYEGGYQDVKFFTNLSDLESNLSIAYDSNRTLIGIDAISNGNFISFSI